MSWPCSAPPAREPAAASAPTARRATTVAQVLPQVVVAQAGHGHPLGHGDAISPRVCRRRGRHAPAAARAGPAPRRRAVRGGLDHGAQRRASIARLSRQPRRACSTSSGRSWSRRCSRCTARWMRDGHDLLLVLLVLVVVRVERDALAFVVQAHQLQHTARADAEAAPAADALASRRCSARRWASSWRPKAG